VILYEISKWYTGFFAQSDFLNAEYPEDFEFSKKSSYSWISADFILHKDGSITNIDIELTFQKKKNYNILYFTTKLKESYWNKMDSAKYMKLKYQLTITFKKLMKNCYINCIFRNNYKLSNAQKKKETQRKCSGSWKRFRLMQTKGLVKYWFSIDLMMELFYLPEAAARKTHSSRANL
jgi:hypothetical protein